ncbi:DUF3151 domain-containing protein [Actinocorallia lasiicapitis]
MSQNLLGGPAPTLLPDLPEATRLHAEGTDPYEVAAKFPAHPAAWAELAERAFAKSSVIECYAYARTGYHRGLDALRRNGWKGHGPIPWEHEANRGFLRCLNSLAKAAAAIGEEEEAERCRSFLRDSSETAVRALA